MSRWATILLILLALGMAAFLVFFEPHLISTREREANRDFVLSFNPAKIRGIRVASGEGGFEITRREDGWWIGPAPKDFASPQKVAEVLAAAANLRVYDTIRASELQGGRDLDDYGLDKPRNHIDLKGDGEDTLYFGKEAAGEGRIYMRQGDSKDVYVVSDELQRLAFRNPQEFRDRRLTSLRPDQIERFTIKRGAGEVTLERGARGWEITRPLHARADDRIVEELLGSLLGLQIMDFVADEADDLSAFGLTEPRAELVLQVENEARPVALRIGGDATVAGAKAVVAQFTGRDSVYHLPERAWTALQAGPDDLRDRRVTDLNLDTVDAVRIRSGGRNWTIERSEEDWKAGAQKIGDREMQRLAEELGRARVIEYRPWTSENAKKTGLDAPAAEISFDAWLSENTPEAAAGRRPITTIAIGKPEGDKVPIRVDENPEIYFIPAVALGAIPPPPNG